jgi:hypothetical protein
MDILFSKDKETSAVHMNIAQVSGYKTEVRSRTLLPSPPLSAETAEFLHEDCGKRNAMRLRPRGAGSRLDGQHRKSFFF